MGSIDEAMAVRAGLDAIDVQCREILDRFFARDESYRAIGEALDIPTGTVASRISRCLAKLRVELEGRW
jgi:RNA polymerase sigma factor (sigma-70 family)